MGWLSDAFSWVADDVLGFDPPKAGVVTTTPTQPAVAEETPVSNQAQSSSTTVDPAQSYLAIQTAKWFNDQLKLISEKELTDEVLRPIEPTSSEFWGQVVLYGGLIIIGYFIFKALT